jgi:hypothetical protein
MRSPIISAISCARWRHRSRSRSLTTLKDKLIKIGAKIASYGRYVAFQMAEVAISRNLFAGILRLIAELRPNNLGVRRQLLQHKSGPLGFDVPRRSVVKLSTPILVILGGRPIQEIDRVRLHRRELRLSLKLHIAATLPNAALTQAGIVTLLKKEHENSRHCHAASLNPASRAIFYPRQAFQVLYVGLNKPTSSQEV